MATHHSAQVSITNETDGTALIQLYHNNSSNGTQSGAWTAAPGQTVGPLTVEFETGIGSYGILDYWYARLIVVDGSAPGVYSSSGPVVGPIRISEWKECQLQSKDVSKSMTFAVDTRSFKVNLDSGGCTARIYLEGPFVPAVPVANVFVLMLENHSFDNMFALSGIPGLTVATTGDSNSYTPPSGPTVTYPVSDGAPAGMPSDPGHEFLDVVEQLGGQGAKYPPYPAITNSGFLANYATSITEDPKSPPPPAQDWPAIMACFDTPNELPVIFELATEFAVCDHWFASIPGPTWPNRFFVHGASSSGEDDSPSNAQIAVWEAPGLGFTFPNGSIFDALNRAGVSWRVYNDDSGPLVGCIPQVSALKGISLLTSNSLAHFASDLQSPYPYRYTFIEPNYGDGTNYTYEGGSSQHPMDSVLGGEKLLKSVYEAIRNSPLWESSVLIVTYDEHGGFYDHVPPPAAVPPGDNPHPSYSKHGFDFSLLGVRVPAVIVSPLIAKGTVDHTTYDHSSVLKTLETAVNLPPLTQRDAHANSLSGLFSISPTTPRTDCPATLVDPAPVAAATTAQLLTATRRDAIGRQALPEAGNLAGFLGILVKTELELSDGSAAQRDAIVAHYKTVKTRADAQAYAKRVFAKVDQAKERAGVA